MVITLLGYMGSGKSTIGRQLAMVLEYDFVDLDNFIEEREVLSIPEIFQTKGEVYFRKVEHKYLKELLSKDKNIVLSLGGGTPCYANNMGLLKTYNSISFYLKMTPLDLTDRLFNEKDNRPLISHLNNKNALQEFIAIHLFERQSFYQKANHILKTDKLAVKEVVELIVKKLY
jgi:shikimate kinase